jgi:2-desacetyl-2-hydroxyethyl bacteriochlorophyllide A dehydrogenase
MKTAKALWFSYPRSVEFREEDLPELGPEDIQVRAIASGISQGTEMLVYRGQVSPSLEADLPTIKGSFTFPIKYGYASVGRVEEVGKRVHDLKSGDIVFAYHPHQTEYVLPSFLAKVLPRGLEPELGVFAANLETAANVLLDTSIHLGETVLVVGQGVVGLLITQLLRRHGVGKIIAVDPSASRRNLATKLGADVALAPENGAIEEIMELTAGRGADVAIEVSGQGSGLQMAIDAAAFQGQVTICSWYGTKSINLALGEAFHRRRLRLVSSQVSNIDPALNPRWDRERRMQFVLQTLPQLSLASLISHRFPFAEAAKAYELVDQRLQQTVQVVLVYGRT